MLLATGTLAACASEPAAPARPASKTLPGLDFDPDRFVRKQFTADGRAIAVRAYEGLALVSRPVEPEYQAINVYIPEAYFRSEAVGCYTARTAPIFLPNQVGGYMPALPGKPGDRMGPPPPPGATVAPSAMVVALARGFVVASPGARGRTLRTVDGRWTGKAPAAIVDLKAAVRWLRHNAGRMPGDTERIVSNGTSAGGALSALLGTSGNSADFEAELTAIGAAPGRDDIFAVSAFCPITNLEHADAAYEWQFQGLAEYRNIAISMLDFKVERKEIIGQLDAGQLALSRELQAEFVAYVNALGLHDDAGRLLRLDAEGHGTLREHVSALLADSAQRAIEGGADLSNRNWLRIESGRVKEVDFTAYARAAGRMKALPAFDGLALETGENQLFGDAQTDKRHFTTFSTRHGNALGAARADALTVRRMNAMHYASDTSARAAPHWRIRQGTMDRDTSLAIPTLLAASLRERGLEVDLALPWDRPHSGDYDLDELFAWIEQRVAS